MNVITARPRIWLTPARLALLRNRAAQGTARWRNLKALADRPDTDWDIGIMSYALAYQVTQDASYAQKAISLMQESMKAGLGQVTRDQGYDCRTYFPAASLTLDWCWDAMTAAERAALIADMETCAAWVWPETNPDRTNAWSVTDPGNNYFHGFMTTWMAGLALAGSSRQAAALLDLCQTKWDRLVVPYLAGPGAGGYFVEGTSYGVDSVRMILDYRAALATATDLPDPLSGWPEQAVKLLLYLTTPAFDRLVPWGDQTKNSGGALTDPSRLAQLTAAGAMGKATSQWWLDHAVPNQVQLRQNAGAEFLWYPEEGTAEDYRQTWPVFAWAKGSGVAVTRSDWNGSGVQVVIEAGPVEESHQDRAAGGFGLFAGRDWLAAWAKITSHSGIAQDTNDSNCVSIGGQRQTWTQDQSGFTVLEDAPEYTYAVADLTPAYAGQCQKYGREYLFMRAGLLMVRDSLQYPTSRPVFSLHTGGLLPTLTPGGYHVQGQTSQLWGTVLQPGGGSFTLASLVIDRDPGQAGWRLDMAGDNQFLVGLEVAPMIRAAPMWLPVPALNGMTGWGSLVAWPAGPLPWNYVSPGAGTHLLLGLPPGSYHVNGKAVPTTVQGGILMFDGPAPGVTVTVTAADGGSDLTNRTFNVVQGTLITDGGQKITLTGGQLVLQAIPGGGKPPGR